MANSKVSGPYSGNIFSMKVEGNVRTSKRIKNAEYTVLSKDGRYYKFRDTVGRYTLGQPVDFDLLGNKINRVGKK